MTDRTELQKGTFRVRAVPGSVDFGTANSGTEQVAVLCEFVDGPNAGMRAVWYGSFTDKTEDRTLESLRYLGWTSDDLTDMSGVGTTEANGVVDEDTDQNGKRRMRLQFINRLRGASFKNKMDDTSLRAFAARMKGKAIAQRKELEGKGFMPTPTPAGARGNGGQRGDAPPHDDDDQIPF